MNIGQFLDSWGTDEYVLWNPSTPILWDPNTEQTGTVVVSNNGVRNPCLGDMVIFVDETPDDYNSHAHKPALVQHLYIQKGFVHLHVFEAFPQDNRAVDAFYSNQHEPGTFHFIGD